MTNGGNWKGHNLIHQGLKQDEFLLKVTANSLSRSNGFQNDIIRHEIASAPYRLVKEY